MLRLRIGTDRRSHAPVALCRRSGRGYETAFRCCFVISGFAAAIVAAIVHIGAQGVVNAYHAQRRSHLSPRLISFRIRVGPIELVFFGIGDGWPQTQCVASAARGPGTVRLAPDAAE